MASNTQKVLETQLHETLYRNISMLTYVYSPNKNFWDVFKKDMFVRNNKAAFNQVIYYLLYVLNPDTIKQKIPSWPILDVHYERQFRSEVVKYLNELRDIYKNADIPSIMMSQLISPGGFKFAKCMLKLSMFVMHEHLQKDPNVKMKMINKPAIKRNGSNTEKHIKMLSNLKSCIDKETEEIVGNFHKTRIQCENEAADILKTLKELQHDISLLQEKLKYLQIDKEKNKNVQEICNMTSLKEGSSKVKSVCDNLIKIKKLLIYLSKDLVLRNELPEELDLVTLFEKCNLEMERHYLEMTTFTDQELDHYIEKFSKCNETLVVLQNDCTNIFEGWNKISTSFNDLNVDSSTEPTTFDDSTPLAVPLLNSNSS